MISKKTIIIDGSYLGNKRGIGAYVESLISGLKKIKISPEIKVIFIVPLNVNLKIKSEVQISILKKPFINKVIWDSLLLPFYCWLEKGCLLHYTGNTGGSLIPRLLGLKVILTIHDVSFLKPFNVVSKPNSIKQWIGWFYRRFIVKRIAKFSKSIITVSNFAKKDIKKELNIPSKKINVIHNSISPIFATPRTNQKKNNILIVSGPSNQKNLNLTINFLQQNKDLLNGWKINVVGVKQRNSKFIKYIGEINRHELINYYDQASILIMPSLYESFSIPIIEALSRDVFVISSKLGAPPEILRNFGLLYDPKSCKELRKCLIEALKVIKYKINNKARVYSLNFSQEKLAKKTLKIYINTLINKR